MFSSNSVSHCLINRFVNSSIRINRLLSFRDQKWDRATQRWLNRGVGGIANPLHSITYLTSGLRRSHEL